MKTYSIFVDGIEYNEVYRETNRNIVKIWADYIKGFSFMSARNISIRIIKEDIA